MAENMADNETSGAKRKGAGYTRLTPKMMVELAAPHTWSAAIVPVVVGLSYSIAVHAHVSLSITLSILVVAVLMQSAVNTFNDYMDYVKGTDTRENQLDPTDAVLVYNNVNPRAVFWYFVCLMVVAFVVGMYVVVRTSWFTLAIGVLAALIIVLYSVGKTPLSYLPLGEFVSGFTMGGLIAYALCYALTGDVNPLQLVMTIPIILTIGLINMTNNTCDIEKDIPANRKTLSVLLGREKAVKAYHGAMYAIVASVVILVGILFPGGLIVCLCMVLALIPGFRALKANPLIMQTRGPAMGQVVNFNITISVFYGAAMLVGGTMCWAW